MNWILIDPITWLKVCIFGFVESKKHSLISHQLIRHIFQQETFNALLKKCCQPLQTMFQAFRNVPRFEDLYHGKYVVGYTVNVSTAIAHLALRKSSPIPPKL